ncbi:TetR/AcrR family transcriptional regulator [Nocardia terpenica]|uniref:TetR family transcriptional regulator n=1 Tax=Nocardia terpenica TaxID=455432 RepID=A0A6G9Z0F2_9NOCA|nr:TetR/AcrR family transcriptional regulator [Nocardia terpenica]QIS18942.1 TetR family transcriptional regulator [Nocardia terpenica]
MTYYDQTAERQLVEAAIGVMLNEPTILLDRGLPIERICDQAHWGRATCYRRYGTKDQFIHAVLDGLVNSSVRDYDVKAASRAILEAHDGDVSRAVHAMAAAYFDNADELVGTERSLLATVFGRGQGKITYRLRETYQRRDAMALEAFDTFVGSRGATLRQPFTVKRLALVLTALIDGMLLRRHVDPRVVSAQLLADAVLAIAGSVLNTEQEYIRVYDKLGELAPNPAVVSSVPRDPRAAMIAAARGEFGKRGYFSSSLDTIAGEADVPVSIARQIFPTKAHIIVGALRAKYAKLSESMDDDLMIHGDDVDLVVRRHLERCAQLVAQEMVFMDALMAAVAHDTYSEPDGMLAIKEELDFPALLEPVVLRGQRNGRFDKNLSSRDIAALVTNTMLLRCFTRRAIAAEDNAGFVSTLLLDGLKTR